MDRSENIEDIRVFSLETKGGFRVSLSNYGATLLSIFAPNRKGVIGDVLLGYDKLSDYVNDINGAYMGASIGRFANRIRSARFRLNSRIWTLSANKGKHCLHGGANGFDRAVWKLVSQRGGARPKLQMRHHSPDGDQGFPGALDVTIEFSLPEEGTLRVLMEAHTSKACPVNLTSHAYFNLGDKPGSVLGHRLWVRAAAYSPNDASSLPRGPIQKTAGTPFDFQGLRPLREQLDWGHPQIRQAKGFDQNLILVKKKKGALDLAARLEEPSSGRRLELWTSEACLQVYSANYLDGRLPGKAGRRYRPQDGLCLEPQAFPDSPNRPDFPSAVLRPGQRYRHEIQLKFSNFK